MKAGKSFLLALICAVVVASCGGSSGGTSSSPFAQGSGPNAPGPPVTPSPPTPPSPPPSLDSVAGSDAGFGALEHIAVDGQGNVYVTDAAYKDLRKLSPQGLLTTPYHARSGLGPMLSALTVDSLGDAIVADQDCAIVPGHCGPILHRVAPDGTVSVVPITSYSFTNSAGGAVILDSIDDLASDAAGNLYLVDGFDQLLVLFTLSSGRVSSLGRVVPNAVAVDPHDRVYFRSAGAIYRLSNQAPELMAGSATETGSVDAKGSSARFGARGGIAADDGGNLYVADTDNNTVRKVDGSGNVTTIAGVAGVSNFVTGALPGALVKPVAVAVSGSNLYIAMPTTIAVIRNRP